MHHCRTTTASIDWIRHGHACSNAAIDSGAWGPVAMEYVSRRVYSSMAPTVRLAGLSDLGVACVKATREELFIPPPEQRRQGGEHPVPFAANYDAVACSMIPRAIETAMLLFLPTLAEKKEHAAAAALLPVLYVCDGIGEMPTLAMLGFDSHNQTPWRTVRELAEFVEAVGQEHGLDVSNVNLQYAMARVPNDLLGEKQVLKRRPDHPSQFYSSPFMQMMIQNPLAALGHGRRRGGRGQDVRLCVVSHGKYIRNSLSLGGEGGGNPSLFSTPNVSVHRQHLVYECMPSSSWISKCIIGKSEALWAPDPDVWDAKRLRPADVARCGFSYLKIAAKEEEEEEENVPFSAEDIADIVESLYE